MEIHSKEVEMKKGFSGIVILVLIILHLLTSHTYGATLFQQEGIFSLPRPVISGARALAMGGAFIALADDPTGASWNPSGIVKLRKHELYIAGAYLHNREIFTSGTHPESNNRDMIDNLNYNYFAIALPFDLFHHAMTVSASYQRLYEFNRHFSYRLDSSSGGVNISRNRYFSQDGYLGAFGITWAMEISSSLLFGATMNIWTDEALSRNGWDETFTEHKVENSSSGTVTGDTIINDRYSRFRGTNWNFGLLWKISPSFIAGSVIKTPFKASMNHHFSMDHTSSAGSPTSSTLIEDIKLRMPLSYGLGFALKPSEALVFTLDIYRTNWSEYVLIDGQGNKISPIDGKPETSSTSNDTTRLSMGMEYIHKGTNILIPFRWGIFYDPEPSSGRLKKFYGLTIGTGADYGRVSMDIAYGVRWARGITASHLVPSTGADIIQHIIIVSLSFRDFTRGIDLSRPPSL